MSFLKNLDEAILTMNYAADISYDDLKSVHRVLFADVYPWAGQDRLALAPGIAVSRADRPDLFAHPRDIANAVEYGLGLGRDPAYMAAHPGEVMGYLAHAHPFLEGNGRTIIVAHSEIARRAGISIDWTKADKAQYLEALTRELENPGKGELDTYLKPFIGPPQTSHLIHATLSGLAGLRGRRQPVQIAHDKPESRPHRSKDNGIAE